MAFKKAMMTTLATLRLLNVTATATSAAPTLSPSHTKLNTVQSLRGVSLSPSRSTEDTKNAEDRAALITLSRTKDDSDGECHWVWVNACYTKDGEVYCKRVRVEVCGGTYSGSVSRTAAESSKDDATVNDDHTAANTLSRTEEDSDGECHWVWVNACYTKEGEVYCKQVRVDVCGGSSQ